MATSSHLRLHTAPHNKNAFKALIAAEYSGIQIEQTPDFALGRSNFTPEFLQMNPIGKVPVLETPEGVVFESNTIARHVCRLAGDHKLYPSEGSILEQSQIDQWMDFAGFEIDTNMARWLYPRHGYGKSTPEDEEIALTKLRRALDALNGHLKGRTHLVGSTVTLADVVMACTLSVGYRLEGLTDEFMANYRHVDSYFVALLKEPEFNKYLGGYIRGEGSLPPPSSLKENT